MNRAVRSLTAIVALTVAGGILGSPAHAAVLPVRPIRVIMAGPTVRIPLHVITTTATTYRGGHGVTVGWCDPAGRLVETDAFSDGPYVDASITVPSMYVPAGTDRFEIVDMGDGVGTPVMVHVLRASRVVLGPLTAAGGGIVTGTVALQHYVPSLYGYVGAPASPVWVERWTPRGWVNAGTWTTDTSGVAQGAVVLPFGWQRVRVERPDGARDAGVVSAGQWLYVL